MPIDSMLIDTEPRIPDDMALCLTRPFERIVLLSGAGMSADSGIPTFRSGSNGLWQEFDPEDLATPQAWQRNRNLVWGWYEWRRGVVMAAQPNPGHIAAATLQKRLGAAVITQNVDDLHERGGATGVLHLHGSLFAPRCTSCARPAPAPLLPPENAPRELTPPRCTYCGDDVRPGIVWFGESLDAKILSKASALVSACDLLLVIGTSGVVYPAAGMAAMSPSDAVVIEINPQPTGTLDRENYSWTTTAALGLPVLARHLVGD